MASHEQPKPTPILDQLAQDPNFISQFDNAMNRKPNLRTRYRTWKEGRNKNALHFYPEEKTPIDSGYEWRYKATNSTHTYERVIDTGKDESIKRSLFQVMGTDKEKHFSKNSPVVGIAHTINSSSLLNKRDREEYSLFIGQAGQNPLFILTYDGKGGITKAKIKYMAKDILPTAGGAGVLEHSDDYLEFRRKKNKWVRSGKEHYMEYGMGFKDFLLTMKKIEGLDNNFSVHLQPLFLPDSSLPIADLMANLPWSLNTKELKKQLYHPQNKWVDTIQSIKTSFSTNWNSLKFATFQ